MEPLGTQNLKNPRKQSTPKNIKNTTLKKSGFGWKMTSFWDSFFVLEGSFCVPGDTKIHKILKIDPRTSKITKNLNSDIQKAPNIMILASPKSRKFDCKLLAFCILVFSIS